MTLLEGLRDAETPLRLDVHPAWAELVTQVREAGRKSELRKVEDQVDAVVCAYVALYAEREPKQVTTYGDLANGYIVTPSLPEGLTASPRPSRAELAHERTLTAYAARLPALHRACDTAVALVTGILDDAGINYLSISGRAKSVASFAGKAVDRVGDEPRYSDPLAEMADQVGVRIVTYLQSDVVAAVDVLGSQFQVLADRDKGQETASKGRFGYASRHLDLMLDPDDVSDAVLEPLRGQQFEVQIRTVLQHAWAEFEHDIRYKGTIPDAHAPDLDRRLTLAAGLLELADREFSTIRDRLQAEMTVSTTSAPETDLRIGARDLATYLVGRYADAGWSKTDHYVWMSGLLHELGITSPDQLAAALRDVDSDAITARMAYKYPAGAVRRLDDDLLALYGERYVALPGNVDRAGLLASRLAKMTP
jgi:ppGpp synthetase/RelA/SpoT-type nucleotidyltranferase